MSYFLTLDQEWPLFKAEHICFNQPKTLPERIKIAKNYLRISELKSHFVVDLIDNQTEKAYFGWPERLYVVEKGKVIFKGEKGPEGYKIYEVDEFLTNHFKTSKN